MEYTIDYFASMAEKALAEFKYPDTAAGLYEPIEYAMASGGKRLRPALCLATYAALTHSEPSAAINQALAVEMFHNFTLLHDDVMDRADIRRGRPTVHRRYGENAAILSGDTMLSLAYGLLAQGAGNHFAELFDVFNRTAIEVYEGQQFDTEFEKRLDVTVDEYMAMIRLKTSVLLGCACRLGAMMAGASSDICDAFYNYGVSLGLAFQLQDDWLDTFGDPAVFGKEIGGDIVNNKKTWLLITALSEANEDIECLLNDTLEPEEKIAQVKRIYERLDLANRCTELARQYSDKAVEALADIELDSKARDFFSLLAAKAATRDH